MSCAAARGATMPGMDEAQDGPRVDDATLRDASAIASILVEQHRSFLAFLERRVGDRALAEDILQDAFVRGIEKAPTLRDADALIPWFYSLLRNASLDHHRRTAARSRALSSFASELSHQQQEPETHAAVCACVARLADTLRPEYADAIKRIEVEGWAVKDYAEHLDIPRSNAGVRVFRAREALRKQLQAACGTCATHGCMDCTCAPVAAG